MSIKIGDIISLALSLVAIGLSVATIVDSYKMRNGKR